MGGGGGGGGGAGGPLIARALECTTCGTGDLAFRLVWDPPTDDVDLHVKTPKGFEIFMKEKVDRDSWGKMDRDDKNGGGPENIFWPPKLASPGTYTYWAHYYRGEGTRTVTLIVLRKGEVAETQTLELNPKEESKYYTYDYTPDN
jgi:uncharacterized protein YfaP (DUF2135 family)